MDTFNLFTKMKLASPLVFLSFFLPVNVTFAIGGINGGGGKGVMCGTKLTVLDLYEAEQNKLTLPPPLGNTDAEIDRFALHFIDHFFTNGPLRNDEKNGILQYMKDILNQKVSYNVKNGIVLKWQRGLPFTNDATLPELKPGCYYVQIGVNRAHYFNDQRTIEVTLDPYYWEQLDSLNKAALFFHEFSYSLIREGYQLNDIEKNKLTSDEIRKVIGLLFAGVEIPRIIGQFFNANSKIFCGFGGGTTNGGDEEHFEIYAYEDI